MQWLGIDPKVPSPSKSQRTWNVCKLYLTLIRWNGFRVTGNHRECISFGTLVHCSCIPVVTLESAIAAAPGWVSFSEVLLISAPRSMWGLPLLSFLSAPMGSGFASSGMFCMWPAINSPLECRLLTAPHDCVGDGDPAEACRTGSCLLAFYRKKLVAGNLESVTFKIHFITLVNKKWQTEENWKEILVHTLAWHPSRVDRKFCYGTAGLALQVIQLEAACGRRGHRFPGSPFHTCRFRSGPLAQSSDKLPDSLLWCSR